jgi:hypothetical protein
LAARHVIGIDQITFETDYPHQDSTWPHTLDAVRRFADELDDGELHKILRGNAAHLLGLETERAAESTTA